jgi:hypothetical protein
MGGGKFVPILREDTLIVTEVDFELSLTDVAVTVGLNRTVPVNSSFESEGVL